MNKHTHISCALYYLYKKWYKALYYFAVYNHAVCTYSFNPKCFKVRNCDCIYLYNLQAAFLYVYSSNPKCFGNCECIYLNKWYIYIFMYIYIYVYIYIYIFIYTYIYIYVYSFNSLVAYEIITEPWMLFFYFATFLIRGWSFCRFCFVLGWMGWFFQLFCYLIRAWAHFLWVQFIFCCSSVWFGHIGAQLVLPLLVAFALKIQRLQRWMTCNVNWIFIYC